MNSGTATSFPTLLSYNKLTSCAAAIICCLIAVGKMTLSGDYYFPREQGTKWKKFEPCHHKGIVPGSEC